MKVDIHSSWNLVLSDYFEKEGFKVLTSFVRKEYLSKTIYPKPSNLFNAFNTTSFDQLRVVIIGQDPYHGPNQAMGLSFSVPKDVRIPPSLQNIYKEIESDLGTPSTCLPHGDLSSWAKQGVLLLNSVLTVRRGEPASHAGKGWESFTDYVIQKISDEKDHVVFMLWGAYAQKKGLTIDRSKHLVLESSHPSPLGAHRGFIGCKHFSQANAYLESHDIKPIKW